MTPLAQVLLPLFLALAGGGLLGAWFTHRRELPKARAEARNMDWVRFQGEIARLDKKIAALETQNATQEAEISLLQREVNECHASKNELTIKVAHLETLVEQYRGDTK